MLAGRGFKEVYSLAGGIKAWQGQKAWGPEQSGLGLMRGDETQAGLLAVAFGMEKGLSAFYQAAAGMLSDGRAAELVKNLSGVEERHAERVLEMFEAANPTSEDRLALQNASSDTTEGGFISGDLRKVLEQSNMGAAELIDWAMALEAQAMDLYLRMARRASDPDAARALRQVGDEEKAHLESLAGLRDQYATN